MRTVAIGILSVYVQDSNNKWDAVHVMTCVMLLIDFNSPSIRHTSNRLAPPGQTCRCGSLIFSAKSAGLHVYVGVSAPCENVVQRNQQIDNKFTECTKYSTNNELKTRTRARHAGSCD